MSNYRVRTRICVEPTDDDDEVAIDHPNGEQEVIKVRRSDGSTDVPDSHLKMEAGGAYCGAEDASLWSGEAIVSCVPCLRACVAHQGKILDGLISQGNKVPSR